jgi:putative PIN family toxin of toxin-antitoxin system
MIRVVIDTNVFISATFLPHSKPAKIINWIRGGKVVWVTSLEILEEITRVLLSPRVKKRHGLTAQQITKVLEGLIQGAEITPGTLRANASRDPADNKFLACAVEGQADYLVSGDKDLTDLKSYQDIPIVSPAAFLEIIDRAPHKDRN